jgi:MYXO-CTERM domain-containing protein
MDAGGMDAGAMTDGGPSADAGVMADAGAPMDAGVPDSGLPLMDASAAMPDGGTPDAGNPLGEPCTGTCPAGYLCYADDGVPPGICVPPCNAGTRCPVGYECSESLDVCTRSSTRVESATPEPAGCGCRTAGTSSSEDLGALAWTLLLALGSVVRRRRWLARGAA